MSRLVVVEFNDHNGAIEFGNIVGELIRCKDCKHWCKGDEVYGICYRCPNTRQMRYDDFCSYGEREGE